MPSTSCPPCSSSRTAGSCIPAPVSMALRGSRPPCRRHSVADQKTIRGAPPRTLRLTFVVVAWLLRAMGGSRYVVADAAGAIAYALPPVKKRRLAAHLPSRAAGGVCRRGGGGRRRGGRG